MTNTTEPYTHELLKNFSSVVTSPETVHFSNSTASSQSDALRHRNLFIGVSGIVLNLSGILLLVTSRHVKVTLKISLLSLLVNDLMFLTVLFALGTLSSTLTTNHAFCWPVLYLSYTSVIVSYLSVCQLALQNYIAVFYPLSCNRIVTLTKVTLSTVVIWVMGFLVCLGCTGLKFEKNQLCIALVPVPTSGIGGIAVTCVICAGVVSAINIKIFTQIRRRNRRVGVAVPDDTSTSVRTVSENLQKSEFSPETLQVPSRLNIVSMVILVSSKNFQKLTFAQSGVGIFVSSLVTVNVLGNPVLYAWRFIQWRKMFSKLRQWRRNLGLV
ncbi:somatostatin receptor type 5-like [Physella acuta]|uniref:somatostatin receptor type 5-like n=1 Tax=Physella acuta TaxID=109671 RepID=UPI0027DBBC4A|nr:somatostatin receptor type 5-like [Physella acuta]